MVLAFERKSGEAVPAADVLKAEGALNIEGVPLQAAPEGLTAELQGDALQKAGDAAYLKKLLHRYLIVTVRKEPERTVLVVEPLFMRAEDVTIAIKDAAGEPVHGCELELDVSADRRVGEGWSKLGEKERTHGLQYSEADSLYALNLPADIESNELLISTGEPGTVARLSNTAQVCELEARPLVTVEEIRGGRIVRSLRKAGSTLIAVFSTDSGFAGSVGASVADGFWSDALRLVNVISTASWEKKVLARAQAPGVSPETGVLQVEGQGGALAGDGSRGGFIKTLGKGSQGGQGPASIFQVQPVARNQDLDLALKAIRDDAGISLRYSVKQEALVLIEGSVKETASDFCLQAAGRDKTPLSSSQWVKQARRIFALDVWSQGAIDAMLKTTRIKPAENAPEGVYVCNISGPEAEKIALYGIVPKTLSDGAARAKAFAYLTGRANTFLKP